MQKPENSLANPHGSANRNGRQDQPGIRRRLFAPHETSFPDPCFGWATF
jgi:hypothetical protein